METKRLKRLLSLLLCICMVACMLPVTAGAANITTLIVGGTTVVEKGTVSSSVTGEGWSYADGTLTLNGASISTAYTISDDTYGIYVEGDLNLVLEGTSTVQNASAAFYCGVYVKGDLTVSGDGGSLNAEGANYGVYVDGKMTVESGDIVGTSCNGSTDSCRGILATSDLTVRGGSVTGKVDDAASGSNYLASGVATSGVLTVSGGSITGNANSPGRSGYGVYAGWGMTVESGTVTGTSNYGGGIYSNRYLNISGGTISGTTTSTEKGWGIYASYDITITGSPNVTATSATAGQTISTGDSSYYKFTVNGTRYEPAADAKEFTVVDGAVTGGAQIWTPAVWVNGENISAAQGQDYTVACGTGIAEYDPKSKTLTLTNATISQTYDDKNLCTYGIYAEENLTLVLVGANTVDNSTSASYCSAFGVYIEGSLTVSGGGTLAATGKDSGIMAGTDLTVSGGTISGASSADDGTGIFTGNDLTVSGSGSVKGTATGGEANDGIYVTNTLTVSDSGSVEGTTSGTSGSSGSSNGICVEKGNLTVSGSGSVKGTASGISGNGISVKNGYTTVESGSVEGTATGNGGNGISVRFLEVKSGIVTGTNNGSGINYGRGISVSSTMTVSGGTVTGTSAAQRDNGIHVTSNDLTVSGGNVTGSATNENGYGIYADYGNIIITGNPTVTAQSAAKGKTVEIEENSKLLVNGTRYVPSATATTFKVENGQVADGYEIWTPEIWVNGVKISTAPNYTVECGTGTAVYDPNANTLTLTGATINTEHEVNITGGNVFNSFGIYADSDLTLVLAGKNTIENTTDPFDGGVYVDGSLTVRGDGSLTAHGKEYGGIGVIGNMTVESGTVTGNSTVDYGTGIGVKGTMTVNGGTVTGTANGSYSSGIAVKDSVTVNDGTVTGNGNGSYSSGIDVDSLDVSGSGTVTGTATGSDSCGIDVDSLDVSGSGTVSGEGTGYGIVAYYLTANGGNVTGEGSECGISGMELIANGGTVSGTATGESGAGIYAVSYLAVYAGKLTGTAGEGGWGLYTDGYLNFVGGTIHGKGSEAAIVAFANGNHTAGELITLPEGYVLNGYEMKAVDAQNGEYTIASFVNAGGTLAYDPDMGTITGAVMDITLTAPDKPFIDTDPDDPGTGGDDPGTGGGSSSGGGSSGNKTETTTNPDGSTTTTVTKPDGSTTETTKYTDGSTEVVETKKDGTVTTTVTDTAGNKTEVVENTDGTSQTTVTMTDGSGSVTVMDENGKVVSEATLSESSIAAAQAAGVAVALPMPQVPVTTDQESAPTVTVSLPTDAAKVEIPVAGVTAGTVAVLVNADGTEEVIKTSLPTENGVAVTLSDGDTVKIVDNTKDFADVSDSYWGAGEIAFATSRELFNGTSANTFSPEGDMTRAMVVTVLARYEGVDTDTGDTWYDAGRDWAMQAGISDGSNMQASITREQLAAMLYRYAGEPAVSGAISGFTDAAAVSAWAQDAMLWATQTGLINGVGGNVLNPQGTATRAQVAAILARFVALTA